MRRGTVFRLRVRQRVENGVRNGDVSVRVAAVPRLLRFLRRRQQFHAGHGEAVPLRQANRGAPRRLQFRGYRRGFPAINPARHQSSRVLLG